MIKISVDEAYAFDYLSILDIKLERNDAVKNIIDIIKNDLINQLGFEKFNEIIASEEYINLKHSNKLTFDAVNKAKTDEVLASFVDTCNYQRMICKKKLQDKFFDKKLSELKIGYEKLKQKNN
jgi:hypothetical protein